MLVEMVERNPSLNSKLGRLIYGNLCSFSLNHRGRQLLSESRSTKGIAPATLDIVKQIDRVGYYQMPAPLPDETMRPVVEAYQAALADPNLSADVASTAGKNAGLTTLCRSVEFASLPVLENLITPEVEAVVSAFYGGKHRRYLAGARRTFHIPTSGIDVYSNSWHCDNEPSERIKVFVALSDIDADSGPTHLLSRKNTRYVLQSGFKSRDDYGIPLSTIEDSSRLKLFTGPVGSVLFVNVTQCLHRAGVPAVGKHRDVAEIQFSLS